MGDARPDGRSAPLGPGDSTQGPLARHPFGRPPVRRTDGERGGREAMMNRGNYRGEEVRRVREREGRRLGSARRPPSASRGFGPYAHGRHILRRPRLNTRAPHRSETTNECGTGVMAHSLQSGRTAATFAGKATCMWPSRYGQSRTTLPACSSLLAPMTDPFGRRAQRARHRR